MKILDKLKCILLEGGSMLVGLTLLIIISIATTPDEVWNKGG
jgi:hypothetical protein